MRGYKVTIEKTAHFDKPHVMKWLLLSLVISLSLSTFTIIENLYFPYGFTQQAGTIMSESHDLPNTVVVRIDEYDIRLAEYERALTAYAKDKQSPLTQQDKDLVLEKLIDEQLLLNDGLNSPWLMKNRHVRNTVIQSLLAGIITQTQASDSQSSERLSDENKLTEPTLEVYIKQLRKQAIIKENIN